MAMQRFLIAVLIFASFSTLLCYDSAMALENTSDQPRLIRELEGFYEYELPANGLRILLREDHTAPVATLMINYLLGSRFESDGLRGSTHLLEHMMFKDTQRFRKETGNSIPRVLQKTGAVLNATTQTDGTFYYEMLPSDKLEIALEVEAERMRGLLLKQTDFEMEMPVVLSEFDRLENSPLTALDDALWMTAFTKHAYHYPIIGKRQDIETMTAASLRKYYDAYYWPNNAVLIAVGDFDRAKILGQIQKYFGVIPRSPQPTASVTEPEPPQTQKRFVRIERSDKTDAVIVAFKIPPAVHPDTVGLNMLASILGQGKTSPLYRALVDRGLAVEADCEPSNSHDPGLFFTRVILTPKAKHDQVVKILLDVFKRIQKKGIPEKQLERTKNLLRSQIAYSWDGTYAVASQLSAGVFAGDWTLFPTAEARLDKVTREDIQRVARTYLVPEKMTVAYLVSKDAGKTVSQPGQNQNAAKQVSQSKTSTVNETAPALPPSLSNAAQTSPVESPEAGTSLKISEHIRIRNVGGIKCMSMKTDLRNVVTLMGSFEGAGSAYAENSALASITSDLLDEGTRHHGKFEIAEILENYGANIAFSIDHERLGFNAQCLKKDLPMLLFLIAEELRYPKFSKSEFKKQKAQHKVNLTDALHDTVSQSYGALNRAIYPPSHIYYQKPFEQQIRETDRLSLKDVKKFHRDHYGPQDMVVVATGDVDAATFEDAVQKSLADWEPKKLSAVFRKDIEVRTDPVKDFIPLTDKVKLDVFWGHALPLTRHSPDYLSVFFANVALGGDFLSRLPKTIREEQGLTYLVHSTLDGIAKDIEGSWHINIILNADLLAKGIGAVEKELLKFSEDGITAEELADQKETIVGRFKVSFENSGALADRILNNEEYGFTPDYLDNYPKRIHNLTLEQVNRAIRLYFHPDRMNRSIAGTADEKTIESHSL